MEFTNLLKQKELEIQQLKIEKSVLEKKLKAAEQSVQDFSKKTIGSIATEGWTIERCIEDIYNHLENIIAILPGHIYWLNRKNIYLGCNDEQAKSAGLASRRELIGKTNYDLPWRDTAKEVDKINREVMNTGLRHVIEEHGIISTGQQRTYLTNKTPLRDRKGNIIGVLGVSLDITDRKNTEKLQKEKEVTEQVSRAIEMLAGCVAHEIRTPLTIIELNVDRLQTAKNEDKTKFIKNIKIAIERGSNIIDMLLIKLRCILTKQIDNQQFAIHSIKSCINDALIEYPFYGNEFKNIVWNNKSNKDFTYVGNDLLTKHILFNLIRNSLKAIREAGRGKIYINLSADKNLNCLIFKDTATGIDTEVLKSLFQPFNSNSKVGTGLGLAFCKMTMKSYGGDIKCRSKNGEYTEFTLSFPR